MRSKKETQIKFSKIIIRISLRIIKDDGKNNFETLRWRNKNFLFHKNSRSPTIKTKEPHVLKIETKSRQIIFCSVQIILDSREADFEVG